MKTKAAWYLINSVFSLINVFGAVFTSTSLFPLTTANKSIYEHQLFLITGKQTPDKMQKLCACVMIFNKASALVTSGETQTLLVIAVQFTLLNIRTA